MIEERGVTALRRYSSHVHDPSNFASHQLRSRIHPGQTVDIVLKKDQPTGRLTRGVVGRILTNSPNHWRGIKVMLTDGQVGRVQAIIAEEMDDLLS